MKFPNPSFFNHKKLFEKLPIISALPVFLGEIIKNERENVLEMRDDLKLLLNELIKSKDAQIDIFTKFLEQ